MKPGPPPKPTSVKRLEGNPGQYPLNDKEPTYSAGCSMPAWLPPGAKREWKRVAPHLEANGLLSEVDMAAFAGYCIAVDQLERSTRALKPTKDNPRPEVQITKSDYEAVSGNELMRRQALKEIRAFAAEFGLTPAQRSRLSAPERPDDDLESLVSDAPN
jgi:P27 family predicted phage terminase small subunit